MPPTKPFALIPAYSHVDHRLLEALGRSGVPYHAFHECSDLPKCRSQLISAGLAQTDADVFLLIDSDMTPTAEHLATLLASPKLTAKSAVTGGYVTRMGSLAVRPKDLTRAVVLGEPGVTELEAAGLGFCAVTRSSLGALAAQLPVLVDEKGMRWQPFCVPFVETGDDGVSRYYPDDWALWARLATVGVSLWLDNALLVPHILREPRVALPGRVEPVATPAPVTPPEPQLEAKLRLGGEVYDEAESRLATATALLERASARLDEVNYPEWWKAYRAFLAGQPAAPESDEIASTEHKPGCRYEKEFPAVDAQDCPRCSQPAAPTRTEAGTWRVGTKLGRTLYRDEVLVGLVDTPEIAAEIVAAMNGGLCTRTYPLDPNTAEDPCEDCGRDQRKHEIAPAPPLVRPRLSCCLDGDHSFSWRQGLEACRYCGEPKKRL